MEYVTFYDVSQAGYRQWAFPAFGLIFVAIGLLSIRYRARVSRYPWFGPVFLVFSIIWTVGAFQSTYLDYRRLSAALTESQCVVVEGVVTDVQLLPSSSVQKAESFMVAGTRFEYSGYTATAGFNQMRSHGGPMRDGLHIRIHHLDGEIARLEIAAAM